MRNPFAPLGRTPRGERLATILRSPNFRDGAFQNPVPTTVNEPGTMMAMLRHQLLGKEQRHPPVPVPIVPLAKGDFHAPPPSGLRISWLGHSSTLIEIDGLRVLVDPLWCERASPSQLFGPRRFHPPPLPLSEVPPIDVVLITHDHYDHLDMEGVRALAAAPEQEHVRFVTALGVGEHLESWGIGANRITELDWNDSTQVGTLRILAHPARHFSGRGIKRNQSLWASWSIVGPQHRVFHSGDTGFFEGLSLVGQHIGPFDVTMIKMGAYGDAWPDIHLDPEGAVRVHGLLGGGVLLPIHWGTFNLAFHAWDEPAERMLAAAALAAGTQLVMPRPGERFEPEHPLALTPWWRDVR